VILRLPLFSVNNINVVWRIEIGPLRIAIPPSTCIKLRGLTRRLQVLLRTAMVLLTLGTVIESAQ
jgi:hypothetical protein